MAVNDTRGRDARRQLAEELADRLATAEGARTARLLQMLGFFDADEKAYPSVPDPETGEPRAISIWQPRWIGDREISGELIFERPPSHPLGDHYAATPVLRAAKPAGVRRVVLCGESAAAGYLYAPHHTPAKVLATQLAGARKDDQDVAYEVVDLARTNERLETLAMTVESARQLDPDLLVIFAGNNWNLLETPEISPFAPSVRARQRYALALRQSGLAGPAALAARVLQRRVAETFERVAKGGIEGLVVVPEVDLTGWQSRQPAPLLPGDGVARWYRRYAETVAELEAGRFDAAAAGARALIELEAGAASGPSGHLLLGHALIGLGDLDDAYDAFCEATARAAYPTAAFLGAPQATPRVQELLRAQAARHGFALVDLPRLFAEHSGSSLPARDLFVDYCHLSAAGMALAMSAVAAEILSRDPRVADSRDVDRRVLEARASTPSPAVEAVARLGAAVHAAHRQTALGDPLPAIERRCREALRADPEIAAAMRALLAVRAAPCPALLHPAVEKNLASRHRLLLQHGWRWEHLDPDLLEAICRVLEPDDPEIREHLASELLRHHESDSEGRELTRPPYLARPVERFLPEAMDHADLPARAVYRAAWPESVFCLVADGARDLELEVVARLPAVSAPGEARFALADRVIGHLTLGATWRRQLLRLPAPDLVRGLNRLALCWPLPADLGPEPLAPVLARLEQGLDAEVHPIFGELFSLRARAVGGRPRGGVE